LSLIEKVKFPGPYHRRRINRTLNGNQGSRNENTSRGQDIQEIIPDLAGRIKERNVPLGPFAWIFLDLEDIVEPHAGPLAIDTVKGQCLFEPFGGGAFFFDKGDTPRAPA